ncbi:hypothetical protein TNIN_373441 [Trichonephila inaurata madagascariensis]|uniref:Uncharacterized protein n=1 Tax=Trichonephila inaurata madagascariensis TaxID=2747483 RepID=A0A8X6MII2_9ARAC|nr:hypothetical protein TNIN_373441 [Trichonephila inaurata madagascariensis]
MKDKMSINFVLSLSKVRPIFVAEDSRAEKASLNALSDLPVMPVSLVWVNNCSDLFHNVPLLSNLSLTHFSNAMLNSRQAGESP